MTWLGLLRHELRLAWRSGTEALTAVFFFLLAVALVPLAIGPERDLVRLAAPGLVWLAVLLATVGAAERLLAGDLEDGALEQLALSGRALELALAVKALALWLTVGLPLLPAGLVAGLALGLERPALGGFLAGGLLGTPVLALLALLGAAVTLGARRGGPIVALVLLPLYIPVLVFAAGLIAPGRAPEDAAAALWYLGALLVLALVLAPVAAAAAVRQALE